MSASQDARSVPGHRPAMLRAAGGNHVAAGPPARDACSRGAVSCHGEVLSAALGWRATVPVSTPPGPLAPRRALDILVEEEFQTCADGGNGGQHADLTPAWRDSGPQDVGAWLELQRYRQPASQPHAQVLLRRGRQLAMQEDARVRTAASITAIPLMIVASSSIPDARALASPLKSAIGPTAGRLDQKCIADDVPGHGYGDCQRGGNDVDSAR